MNEFREPAQIFWLRLGTILIVSTTNNIHGTVGCATFSFPSPRPSPQGRGRIVRRLRARAAAEFSKPVCARHASVGGCSLSPGERVRVRGDDGSTTAECRISNRLVSNMLPLGKYSIGMGDRFAHQAKAQLRACMKAAEQGVEVIPVWNKSNREHITIGSEPSGVRSAADVAARELKWKKPYHVDADHIRLETVDRFIPYSDFFTIDVADFIGRPADPLAVKSFVDRQGELIGRMEISGID